MKNYDVKHYFQEDSLTCGIATARMILNFYGISVSEKELLKEVYLHDTGTWFSDLAKSFLKRGLKTKIYTINLLFFNSSMIGFNEKEIYKYLKEKQSTLKSDKLIKQAENLLEYIEMGGKIEVKIPEVPMLHELIKKEPFFIPISRSMIYKERIDDRGHYVVINGFDGKNYSIIDPGRKSFNGKEYAVKKNILEYAWLANNRDSDGYLLEIEG